MLRSLKVAPASICFLLQTALLAQLPVVSAVEGQDVAASVRIDSYSFDSPDVAGLSHISVISTPFELGVALGNVVGLSVESGYARGVASSESGEEAVLAAPVDTQVSMDFSLFGGSLLVSAVANLATGRYQLSLEDGLIAGVIASELLPFGLNTWGSGAAIGGDVTMLTESENWGLAVVAGYRAAEEYEPLAEQQLAYRPGNQASIRVAADRNFENASTLGLVAGVTHYSGDSSRGNEIFQAGTRIEAQAIYAFPVGRRNSALFYGLGRFRATGAVPMTEQSLGIETQPAQQLALVGTRARVTLGRNAAFIPSAEGRLFLADDNQSQGWLTSASGALEVRLARWGPGGEALLFLDGSYKQGKVFVTQGISTGINGWGGSLVLSIGGGR